MSDEQLTTTINKSGFPLQIGIAHLLKDNYGRFGWKVLYTEHAWKSFSTPNEGGFIDLVLENGNKDQIIVMECKRVLESEWIFLIPDDEMEYRRASKAWVTQCSGQFRDKFDWFDSPGEPASRQAQYCVVHAEKSKALPTLEKIAAELIASTESLAVEEYKQGMHSRSQLRVYFNVIVTTAKLKVCHFDPASIALTEGTVKEPKYVDVPYIRFRKQFSTTTVAPNLAGMSIRSFITAKESTVFIVNANNLLTFLNEFEIDN